MINYLKNIQQYLELDTIGSDSYLNVYLLIRTSCKYEE